MTAPDDVQLSDYAVFREAEGRYQRLERDLREAEAEVEQIDAHLAATKGTTLRDEAEALLRGDDGEDDDFRSVRERRAELSRRMPILREAVKLAKVRRRQAASDASREACDDVMPAFQPILQRMADAVHELAAAADAQRLFLEQLQRRGIETARLEPMPAPAAGVNRYSLRNQRSVILSYLEDMERRHGIAPQKGR